MHTSEYDYLFKLLLIGDSGVGKVDFPIQLSQTLYAHFDCLVLPSPPFRRRYLYRKLHIYNWR